MKKFSSKILDKVKVIAFGTFLGQVITVVSYPIISRLYTPEEFGVFASYIAIVSILGAIFSFRFDYLILMSKVQALSISLLGLSIILISSSTLFFCVTAELFFKQFFDDIKLPVYFVAIGAFIASVQQAVVFFGVKLEKLKEISQMRISQSLFTSLLQTLSFSFGALGLIVGDILGRGISTIYILVKTIKNTLLSSKTRKLASLLFLYKKLFFKNKNIAFGLLFGNFMYMFSQQFPIAFLNYQYDSATSGAFGLCVRLIGIPAALIGQSYQNVYNTELKNQFFGERNSQKILESYFDVIKNLFKFTFFPVLGICLLSRLLFPIIFGNQWILSGEIMLYLFPSFVCEMIFYPVTHTFIVLNQYKKYLLWEFSRFFTILMLILTAIYFSLGSIIFIVLYSLTIALMYLTLAFMQYRYLKYAKNL